MKNGLNGRVMQRIFNEDFDSFRERMKNSAVAICVDFEGTFSHVVYLNY